MLSRIPKVPSSQGRYRQHDLGLFLPRQLEAVRQLGFEISSTTERAKQA